MTLHLEYVHLQLQRVTDELKVDLADFLHVLDVRYQ